MADGRRMMTRLIAGFKNEVPAAALESLQRAGIGVYRALDEAGELRRRLAEKGTDAWRAPAGAAAQQLFAWNAFVLQTIGDKMIEADYRADTHTVGYLPKVTAEQVWLLFSQVEGWLSLSRQAAANPGFRPEHLECLPARLPGWVEADPCPAVHLEAMIAAGAAIREHAEVALGAFELTCDESRRAELDRLRQIGADAASSADFAAHAFMPDADRQLHELIEKRLQHALERFYQLGQLIAMPGLLTHHERADSAHKPPAKRLPPPGTDGFDPRCLTAPHVSGSYEDMAITLMWKEDLDPERTLAIQETINAALARKDIVRTGATYNLRPWGWIYKVRRPVTIGNLRLRPGQRFTCDVSAEHSRSRRGRSVCRIVTGPFNETR
jgi:hypothetical protein